MDDLISRQAAIKTVLKNWGHSIPHLTDELNNIPPADVRENVKGKWIKRDQRYVGWISFECSACGETLELDKATSDDFKYCPFCGADMRGEA